MAKQKVKTKAKTTLRKPRFREETASVVDAIATAFSIMDDLREECQSWYDNLSENLQGGATGERLQEAIGAIERVDEVTLPTKLETLSTLTCHYTVMTKLRQSRADRRNDAVGILRSAADAVRAKIDEIDKKEEEKLKPNTSLAPLDTADEKQHFDEYDQLAILLDEIESAADEFDGVEFPGMYGR